MAEFVLYSNKKKYRSGAINRLVIKTIGGDIKFESRFAPREVGYGGFEAVYQEVSRPDRQPLLRRSGNTLRTISMDIFVGSRDIENSVRKELKTLERLAKARRPLIIEYDPHTAGYWHITSMSYGSEERTSDKSNEITRATVSIEFTEVTDKTEFTINRKTKIIGTERPKTYKFKKGDTLQKIAKKYYGTTNPLILKAIAKANKIKNPKHIKPGTSLKLP